MLKLGVNIDHVASLRQLRAAAFPDLCQAARLCEAAGADSIVAHLREDRRHIQDSDVRELRRNVRTRFNLEMSTAEEIVRIACAVGPDQATLVPERRLELTTEGGLDMLRGHRKIGRVCRELQKRGIDVSVFIEPDLRHIKAARDMGIRIVELHTGAYASVFRGAQRRVQLRRLQEAAGFARRHGLFVNAGHGLDYENVGPVAAIEGVHELNIGYAIVCRAVFVGLEEAVRSMKRAIRAGDRRR
jgi:pyridoxine 5-phosphate synthase